MKNKFFTKAVEKYELKTDIKIFKRHFTKNRRLKLTDDVLWFYYALKRARVTAAILVNPIRCHPSKSNALIASNRNVTSKHVQHTDRWKLLHIQQHAVFVT